MPRTATPRSNARQSAGRTTHRTQAAGGNQGTPVLFRLPYVELNSLISPPEESEESTLVPPIAPPAEATSESTEPNAGDLPMKGQPTRSAPASDVATARATASVPTTDGERTEPTKATSTSDERSWWEHWSSGVVLILLIIALVAASIMALNDTGSIDPNALADKESEELSLNGIATGDVSIPTGSPEERTQLELPAQLPAEQSQVAQAAGTKVAENPGAETAMNASTQRPATNELVTSNAAAAANTEIEKVTADPEAGAGSGGLIVNVPDIATQQVPLPQLDLTPATSTAPAAQIEPARGLLEQVVESTSSPKYPELDDSSQRVVTQNQAVSPPNVAISTPKPGQQIMLFPELPLLDAAANQPGNIPSASGNPNGESPGHVKSGVNQPKHQTQSPSYTQLLQSGSAAGATDGSSSFKTVAHTRQSTAELGNQAAVQSGADAQTGQHQMMQSVTPEMNAEALIRAYQEFRRLHQKEVQPSNRYITNASGG